MVKLKYNGEKYAAVDASANYYNADGNLIKQAGTVMLDVDSGQTNTYIFDLPKTSKGEMLEYQAFTISLDAYGTSNLSVRDKIEIGVPSEITKGYENETSGSYSATIPIKNNGTAEIRRGEMVVYFWEGETVVDVRTVNLRGIVGNETADEKVYYTWNSKNGEEKHIPDGITVDLNYAEISNQ